MTEKTASSRSLRGPLIAGGLIFLATALASIPASAISLIAKNSGGAFSYSEARGTIWNGELRSVAAADVPLGDVTFRLSPLSVMMLAPSVKLSANGAVRGGGTVSVGLGARIVLRDVKAEIDLGAAAPRGLLGQPARGEARADVARLEFSRKQGCVAAEGDLWTNALDAPAKQYNLPSLPMSGGVACEDGKLAISLAGENERAAASIHFLLDRDLAYEATATAEAPEENLASALRYFGFEDHNGALTYGTVGVITGAGS